MRRTGGKIVTSANKKVIPSVCKKNVLTALVGRYKKENLRIN
jgi:hypothetical protein